MSSNKKDDCDFCDCRKCLKKINKVCNEVVTNIKKVEMTLTKEILHVTKINVYPKKRIEHKYKKVYIYHPEEVKETFSDCEKVNVIKCTCYEYKSKGSCYHIEGKCFDKNSCLSGSYTQSQCSESEKKKECSDKKKKECGDKNKKECCDKKKEKKCNKKEDSCSSDTSYKMLWE